MQGGPGLDTFVTKLPPAQIREDSTSSIMRLGAVSDSLHPALGAKASPEVTLLFCRLPLVTLLHRPEAFHLGVRMRLSVRTADKGIRSRVGFP